MLSRSRNELVSPVCRERAGNGRSQRKVKNQHTDGSSKEKSDGMGSTFVRYAFECVGFPGISFVS